MTPSLIAIASTLLVAPQGLAQVETVRSQPSWVLQNRSVRLAITQAGAHMAPVEFYRDDGKPVLPYYVSPWQDEGLDLTPPVLKSLRGDFFCLPFGGNGAPYKGMQFVPHGEPAGARWTLLASKKQGKVSSLSLGLNTKVPAGKVTKRVYLVDGHNVVYSQERLDGYNLQTSLGHHSILNVPQKEGALKIATSDIRFGRVSPFVFSKPENGEYQSFEVGKRFSSLTKVPLAWKGAKDADASAYPARKGFADLIAVFSKPASTLPQGLAWTTATNEESSYLWFSFRNPNVLPTTVMWIENHGRHGSPWNGRNNCLGLEDVCSYMNEGMPISAQKNDLNAEGIPTSLRLRPNRPTLVNYVAGVARVPKGFVKVRRVEFGENKATFVSVTGKRVRVPVDWRFVRTGQLGGAR